MNLSSERWSRVNHEQVQIMEPNVLRIVFKGIVHARSWQPVGLGASRVFSRAEPGGSVLLAGFCLLCEGHPVLSMKSSGAYSTISRSQSIQECFYVCSTVQHEKAHMYLHENFTCRRNKAIIHW